MMLASALVALLALGGAPAPACRMTAEVRQIAATKDANEAFRRAAILLAEQGKWRAAATAQESADQDDASLAYFVLRSGDVDRAEKLLRELSEPQRASRDAHWVAAELAIERDAETAAEELEAAIVSGDDELLRARIALLRDDASTATKLLRENKTPEGRRYFARALNAAGQTTEAVRVLEQLADEFPPCAGVWREHVLFEAALFASDTDTATAERLYGEAIDAAEVQERAFSAAIHAAKVDLQKPVTGLFVAATREPRDAAPESRNNLGHLLIGRADGDVTTLAMAQLQLRNAAQSRDYATPEYAYIGLARAALAADDREAAAGEVVKALWRAPQHDEALELARSLIREAPAEARLGVGVVFNVLTAEVLPPRFVAREYGSELVQLAEFASQRDDEPSREFSASYALAKQDFDRARAMAADARARFPKSAWPDAVDAAALAASGRDDEARTVFRALQKRVAEDPPRTPWDAATLRPALASSHVFPWEPTPGLAGSVAAGNDPQGLGGTTITVFTEDGPQTVISDQQGRWRVPDLPPGSYSILAELEGMQPAGRIESVTTGETEIELALQFGKVESISVASQAPLIDPLPWSSRVYEDFSWLPTYSPAAINGAAPRENAYYVDGVNVTDAFALSSMQEFSMFTGAFSAEFGPDRLPMVQATSLSGTNTFAGKVVVEAERDTEAAEPVAMSRAFGDDREQEIVRMNAGGPVRRDVLLWFFAADLQRERGEVQPASRSQFTPPGDTRGHTFDFFGKLRSLSAYLQANLSARILDAERSGVVDDPGGSAFGTASSVDRRWKTRDDTFTLDATKIFGTNTTVEGLAFRTNARNSLRPGSAAASAIQSRLPESGFFTTGGIGFINDGRRSENTGGQVKVRRFTGEHDLVAGIDAGWNDDAVSDRLSGGRVLDPETGVQRYWTYGDDSELAAAVHETFENDETSAFVNDTWRYRRFTMAGGVRWTRQHVRFPRDFRLSTSAFQPRLGVAFDPQENGSWKIYASYARFFQSLQRDELVAYGSDRRYVVAPDQAIVEAMSYGRLFAIDPNLQARTNDVLDAGVEHALRPWNWRLGAQYQRLASHIEDFFCTADNKRCIGNPGRGLLQDLPRAEREILSLSGRVGHETKSSSWELAYTWLQSEANTEAPDLASTRVIGIDPYLRSAFDSAELVTTGDLPLPRHSLTATAFKRAEDLISTHDVVVSATVTAQSGLPRGAFGYSPLYGRYATTLVPRGEEPDGDAWIALHAGLDYVVPIGKSEVKFSLIGRNLVGSQTSRVDDQRGLLAPATANPTFLQPMERNEPRSVRALVAFTF